MRTLRTTPRTLGQRCHDAAGLLHAIREEVTTKNPRVWFALSEAIIHATGAGDLLECEEPQGGTECAD